MSDNYDDQYGDLWDDPTSDGGQLLPAWDGTILAAEFMVNPKYNPETVRSQFQIRVDSHEVEDSQVEPGTIFSEELNVGDLSTWSIEEDGQLILKNDGGPPKPDTKSGYGQIIAAAVGKATYDHRVRGGERNDKGWLPKATSKLEGADEVVEILRERGQPHRATIWPGLQFHFERLIFQFYSKDGDEVVDYELVLPTKFLGVDEDVDGSFEVDESDAGGGASSNGEVDEEALVELAQTFEADQHRQFVAKAMQDFDGVDAEAIMDDSEKGLFAKAQAAK